MSEISLNAVQGMLMGAFLGDALGAPHEFKCNRHLVYTGRLEHQAFLISRFQGPRYLKVAQVTDDSEMTLALLRSLVEQQGYRQEAVILAYLNWANSGIWMMGNNTRALFKGVRTLQGYTKRLAKQQALPLEQQSQSNGALMRCSPLALLNNEAAVVADASLSNFHPVCLDCNLTYVRLLRFCLTGQAQVEKLGELYELASTPEVKAVINQVIRREPRDLAVNKGWCLHGLYVALFALNTEISYTDFINWIIKDHPGSDTDTNACIAGAVWGAKYGLAALQAEPLMQENITKLLSLDPAAEPTPRPATYALTDFFTLAEAAHRLAK